MTPAQQRENILRDALGSMVDRIYFVDRKEIYHSAIAAADAIPDAHRRGVAGVGSLTVTGTPEYKPVPDAPVIADGRQVGTLVTAQRMDLREPPPVPSRAELIELMCAEWPEQYKPDHWNGQERGERTRIVMARVLDALIKVGAVRT